MSRHWIISVSISLLLFLFFILATGARNLRVLSADTQHGIHCSQERYEVILGRIREVFRSEGVSKHEIPWFSLRLMADAGIECVVQVWLPSKRCQSHALP